MARPGLASSGFQVCSRSPSSSNIRRAMSFAIMAASTWCSAASAEVSSVPAACVHRSSARRSAARASAEGCASCASNRWSPGSGRRVRMPCGPVVQVIPAELGELAIAVALHVASWPAGLTYRLARFRARIGRPGGWPARSPAAACSATRRPRAPAAVQRVSWRPGRNLDGCATHVLPAHQRSAPGCLPGPSRRGRQREVAGAGRYDQLRARVRRPRGRLVPGLAHLRRADRNRQVGFADRHLPRPLRQARAGRAGRRGAESRDSRSGPARRDDDHHDADRRGWRHRRPGRAREHSRQRARRGQRDRHPDGAGQPRPPRRGGPSSGGSSASSRPACGAATHADQLAPGHPPRPR